MVTTHSKPVGTTGFCSVGYVQGGRNNTKHFYATTGGHVIFVNAQDGTKATALKVAERADRLIAMWRGCAK